MAAKAKETGNIDFTMLYRLFLVYIKVGIPTFTVISFVVFVDLVQCRQWESNFFRKCPLFSRVFMSSSLSSVLDLGQKRGIT